MRYLTLLSLSLVPFLFASCESHSAEDTGEAIDQAVEDAGDALEDAADEVEDAVD